MLRGDGCLTKTTKSGNSQLQIRQKSKEFVEHLWILITTTGIVGALPYTLERFDSQRRDISPKNRAVILCTDSFKPDEVNLLRTIL